MVKHQLKCSSLLLERLGLLPGPGSWLSPANLLSLGGSHHGSSNWIPATQGADLDPGFSLSPAPPLQARWVQSLSRCLLNKYIQKLLTKIKWCFNNSKHIFKGSSNARWGADLVFYLGTPIPTTPWGSQELFWHQTELRSWFSAASGPKVRLNWTAGWIITTSGALSHSVKPLSLVLLQLNDDAIAWLFSFSS